MKRTISALLILALLVGLCPAVQAQEATTGAALSRQEVTVTAENDFAELLSEQIKEELNAQEQNNGYNIFSVAIEGNTAIVELEALSACSLIVGIYDEQDSALLALGSKAIDSSDKTVTVEIETDTMPEYFLIRAYLVDTVNKNPLCTEYYNPNYTQEMQEFLAKTTEDFDSELVLNLDDDPTTNFAIYGESVIQVYETETSNHLSSQYENYYSFRDCDEVMKSLKAGDTIAYTTLEGELLILKLLYAPSIYGNSIDIFVGSVSMEQVFDYVKIDASSGLTEDGYDPSTCEDGVEFVGFEYASEPTNTAVGGSAGCSVKLNLGDEATNPGKLSGKISGSLTLNVKGTFSLYITENYRSMTLLLNYGATINATMSVKAELLDIPLGQFTICPAAGLYIRMTPSFQAEASGKLSFKGNLTGTIGFSANTVTGMRDLTSSPTFDAKIDAEFTLFVGISMKPEVGFVSQYLASASIEATAGVELKAKFCETTPDESYVHECARCLDGDVNVKLTINFEAAFLSNDLWTYNLDIVDLEWKLGDFYWSLTFGEFAFTTCPHLTRKIDVTVYERTGEPVAGATVIFHNRTDEYSATTDGDGLAMMYLTEGSYTVEAERNNRISDTKTVVVDGDITALELYLTRDRYDPETAYAVASVARGGIKSAAAITESGDLYTWGTNTYGQAGVGTTEEFINIPTKILKNVEKVSFANYASAAITKDGDLYAWGNLENVPDAYVPVDRYARSPVKVMSGVKDVAVETENIAVVLENGDLIIWGRGNTTGLGSYDNNEVVLQNVRSVAMFGELVAAVTEENELYVWGNNNCGGLADGTLEHSLEPRKVMDNVAEAWVYNCVAALTLDGNLYTWGHLKDFTMTLGYSAEDYVTTPTFCMSNVVKVSGDGTLCILTNDGTLYGWGTMTLGIFDKKNESGNGIISTPMPIYSDVVDVASNSFSFTVLLSTGEMQVWDLNNPPTTLNLNQEETDTGTENPTAITPQSLETTPILYNGMQKVNFTELTPGSVYQFYVMKDRNADDPFSAENLLYTDQVMPDDWGNLELLYQPTEICPYADVFLVEFVDVTVPVDDAKPVNPFTDVPEDSFYYEPVMWAVENNITTGATDTTFNPDGNCLRAQVVTFLWRAAGEPEPTTTVNPFTDVKETDFFYKAVLWAVENEITNGTSATTFSPYAECNRAAVVTFLYRAMGEPKVKNTTNPFTDVDVTAFYGPAVLWAVEEGITNGMGDGTFGIGKTCNRAQVVTFLYRTYVN